MTTGRGEDNARECISWHTEKGVFTCYISEYERDYKQDYECITCVLNGR